jgi:hypothetical protein
MTTFRDALAFEISETPTSHGVWRLADVILNMPEMRAIHRFVQEVRATNEGYDHLLPGHVIDWVMTP